MTIRETIIDLDNDRWTRTADVAAAWLAAGFDLTASTDRVELDDEEIDAALIDTELLVFTITPHWLGGPDGTLSYSDLVFRGLDTTLYRRQRDAVCGVQHCLSEWA